MKNKRIEEILLPPSIVSFTIVTCFYMLVQYTYSDNTKHSLILLMVIFIVLILVCLVRLFKNGESKN